MPLHLPMLGLGVPMPRSFCCPHPTQQLPATTYGAATHYVTWPSSVPAHGAFPLPCPCSHSHGAACGQLSRGCLVEVQFTFITTSLLLQLQAAPACPQRPGVFPRPWRGVCHHRLPGSLGGRGAGRRLC